MPKIQRQPRPTKRGQLLGAIKILGSHLALRECSTKDYRLGYEALLALAEQPWLEGYARPQDAIWREGYEQALIDIIDAIADEWGCVVWFQ